MKPKAVYALSADPITFGHLDIIDRASRHFNLTVLVANNPKKTYMFSLAQRTAMAQEAIFATCPNASAITVMPVHPLNLEAPLKLTADWAFEQGISTIIRGVRNFSDYDMEAMMRDINISQQQGIETYFLKGSPELSHISSTAAKELFAHAGFIHTYVPFCVKRQMEAQSGVHIIGVTGNICSGKNWYCERVTDDNTGVYHVDLDKLAHFILFKSNLLAHVNVRERIRTAFLDHMHPEDRHVIHAPLSEGERKELGNIVFADAGKREQLNTIMGPALLTAMRQAMQGYKGILLVNSALLSEFKLTHVCNNNIVLVTTDPLKRMERMKDRGYTPVQIKHRLESQYTDERKAYHINQEIEKSKYGKLIQFNNTGIHVPGTELLKEIKKAFGIP